MRGRKVGVEEKWGARFRAATEQVNQSLLENVRQSVRTESFKEA